MTLAMALVIALLPSGTLAADGPEQRPSAARSTSDAAVDEGSVEAARADSARTADDSAADGREGDAGAPAVSGELRSLLDGADELTGAGEPERQERPVAPGEGTATVDEAVLDALADDDRVAVLIELSEQADTDEVAAEAARAGRERARGARQRARERGADGRAVAAAAREAAHAARVSTVVERLRATAAASQEPVAGLLAAEEAAGRAADVRAYWIVNSFAAEVDAAALDRIASHPDVARISLDVEIQAPETESHPRLPTWSLESVRATDTWGEYGFTGEGVVVGVLDTGVDGGHPALSDRYLGRDGNHDRAWYVPTGENYPEPADGHGHGTHVTGSIVGGPPGEVVGVAPDAQWMGIKIFRDSGTTSASIIRDGMQWVLAPDGDPANAPHVVNNSWGAADPTSMEYWDEVSAWVAAGIFPVFANGNSGPGSGTVGSPASFPHSFGVGATDRNDVIASFSSRGPAVWDGEPLTKPDISAPGHEIYSAWPRHTGQDYHTISGTSMASPHVAGVVALLLEARPDLGIDDVRDLLTDTARVEGHMGEVPNDTYGSGIADAYAATTRARFSGTLSGTVTGPDGPIEATVAIDGGDASTTTDPVTGEFEIAVREGTREVTVDAYGYLPAEREVEITAQQETTADFSLEAAPTHAVTGTVTSAGEPLAGARVELEGAPLDAVRTDDDGAFAFEVAEGSYELRVRAHAHAPAAERVTVDADRDLEIALEALGQEAVDGWPEYQSDPARTGFSADEAAPESFEQAWSVDLGGSVTFSSPVAVDGSVYVTTEDGRLHALDADDGSTRWTYHAGGTLRSTPSVAGDRVYLAGGADRTLHALDADTGEAEWTFETDGYLIYSTPTEVDGTVYLTGGFGAGDGGVLYALDAGTGELEWSVDVGPQIFFGPTVADGTVFAASRETGRVVAVDAGTGEERWSTTLDDGPLSMPTYADGALYLGTTREGAGSLLALDADTGETLWEVDDHGDSQGSSPALYGDLLIVGAHEPASVAAYDRDTGERVWRRFGGLAVSSAQAVTADGYVLGGDQDGMVWALDATTGEQVWSAPMSAGVLSAPALSDGLAVFADSGGQLRAYATTGTLEGTVTGPDGPLEATVELAGTGAATTADPDTGEYSLAARPGEHTAEARLYGYSQESAEVTLAPGRTTTLDLTLSAVGDGSLSGTITDAEGAPIEGAEVTIAGTPLDVATTAADGTFAFDEVAAGQYEVLADADGYAPATAAVTVAEGAEETVALALDRYDIAVVADYEGAISGVLSDAGWLVDEVSFDEIVGSVGAYGAIVVNGSSGDRADADVDRFAAIVEEADDAGVSAVFLDQWSVSYGAIRTLAEATGNPERFHTGQRDGAVSLSALRDHPLTAGLEPGERTQILAADSDYAWFEGYAGQVLADLHAEQAGTVGPGIGYERRTLSSAHVLLPAHAATPWSGPSATWQPAARDVLVDAVAHAIAADFGAVSGTVTDGNGDPLAARVTVAGTGEAATAGDDGSYELILEPGEHTLRFERVGFEPREEAVTVTAGEALALDAQLAASGLGTLAGEITDSSGGDPIGGAEIAVSGTDLTATSEEDGTYAISDVPGGTYDLDVSADGYLSRVVEGVEVTDGEVTTADVALELAPRVAVLGDYFGDPLTEFLTASDIEATAVGWEVADDPSDYDVVVLNDPSDPGEAAFLDALAAFDDAGVSVVVGSDGWSFRTGGSFLFVDYLGDPADIDRIGGFRGAPIEYHGLADHPVFDGFDEPVEILTGGTEAGVFRDYSGLPLADVAEQGSQPAGLGMAYLPRTADSVHLFVSGLAATFRNDPADSWTQDGRELYLNLIRWAAAPRLGAIEGTVVDPDDEPIADARVDVTGNGLEAVTDEGGGFTIPHPAGEVELDVSAFGYVDQTVTVDVEAGETVRPTITLEVADVGSITGEVTSSGEVRPDDTGGLPLEGATVRLHGTSRETVTDADGAFRFDRVEPGAYEIEIVADGHVRTILEDVEVTTGEETDASAALRPSPTVGLIDDDNGHATGYLEHWGYEPIDLSWEDTDRIADLDLIVANLASYPNLDPGAEGWRAFNDAVDRARVPVVWLDQFGRGSIQWLRDYAGDPAVREQGRGDGDVIARAADGDHPLLDGLPASFELNESGREYAYFDDYSGEVVATLETGADGEVGATVGYRGRTSGNLDVLLSTLSISFYGHFPYGDEPGHRYTPEAERLFRNALGYALDAPPLAGEARGTLRDDAGDRLAGEVTVVETGETHTAREGDGSFVVPLQPGTWTLEASSFGYQTETVEVTVAAGDVARLDVTLPPDEAGDLEGQVTDTTGEPIEGATVEVAGAPRSAETDADGRWSIRRVPAGDWTVEASAPGFMAASQDVTVVDGGAHTVDFALADSRTIAIAGDQGTQIEDLLATEGYEVDQYDYADLDEIAARVADYPLVILNGRGSRPSEDAFTSFLDAAEDAETSVLFAGMYSTGGIRQLSDYTGDPGSVSWSYTGSPIYYDVAQDHPIFAGLDTSEPIELMADARGGNQQYQLFDDYSGETIADLDAPDRGDRGGGVAYQFSSPRSVHVLLASLQASFSSYGGPDTNWTDEAKTIYLNAVAWAVDAAQAEIHGVVTSDGEPLAGARVTAVEAGISVRTDSDGAYSLGVPDGEHTIRAELLGYETVEDTVAVADDERLRHDVELPALARGALEVEVLDDEDEAPVEGAEVTIDGPAGEESAETGGDGLATFDDLLEGDYDVSVSATGYLPFDGDVEVVGDETARLQARLVPNSVAVIGDEDGAFVEFLRDEGIAAEERGWDVAGDVDRYDVVVVNDAEATAEALADLVEGADEAETSLLLTGSWGVEHGGIRALAEHTEDVAVGGHGYGDGEVALSGFDPDHPLFDGLEDPTRILADDAHHSWLEHYVGPYLADLDVDGETVGTAMAYDFRGPEHVHLLVSFGAVTPYVGPGYGWTPETERLTLNAIEWARSAEQEAPPAPTLRTEADDLVASPTITVSGEAEFRAEVEIVRGEEVIATAEPERDGSYEVDVDLVEGVNRLVAVVTNFAGAESSEPLSVVLDTTGPELDWVPADGEGFFDSEVTVEGVLADEHAGVAEASLNGEPLDVDGDGRFSASVALEEGANTLELSATDALGNETVETRTVAYLPLSAEWEVPPDRAPRRAVNVRLHVRDADGEPTEVDGAVLEARDADGEVAASEEMRWSEERYQQVLRGVDSGEYDLFAHLDVGGWAVTLAGPAVEVR